MGLEERAVGRLRAPPVDDEVPARLGSEGPQLDAEVRRVAGEEPGPGAVATVRALELRDAGWIHEVLEDDRKLRHGRNLPGRRRRRRPVQGRTLGLKAGCRALTQRCDGFVGLSVAGGPR